MRPLILVLLVAALLLPTVARADHGDGIDGVLVRVNGDAIVGADEHIATIVVVRGDLEMQGSATTVVVVKGTATLSGAHVDNLILISGTVNLEAGTIVDGKVRLVDSKLNLDPQATVRGSIELDAAFPLRWGVALGVFSILAYISVAIAVLLSGLAAAALASRQLRAAADMLQHEVGRMLLATLILWVAVPLTAVVAFLSIVGIATGIGIVVFVAPALWFIGYVVAGFAIGERILVTTRGEQLGRPYWGVTLGLAILLVLGAVPVLGAIVTVVAGVVGAGAVALAAWRSLRGAGAETATAAQP